MMLPDQLITETANNVFVFSSVVLLYYCRTWIKKHGETWEYLTFVIALSIMVAAIATRIGWWSVASMLAPDGATHLPVMFELRWLLSAITATSYFVGVVMLLQFVEEFSNRRTVKVVTLILSVSLFLAVF